MSHAEKCPICLGEGKVPDTLDNTKAFPTMTCHGCKGKGWIEVQDVIETAFPRPPHELDIKPCDEQSYNETKVIE